MKKTKAGGVVAKHETFFKEKKKKSKSSSYYRNLADRLFQDWFTKENPKCEMCGNPSVCGHHFHTKGNSSRLRYEPDNMIPVCSGCHLSFHSKRSAEITSRLIAQRGIDWSNNLLEMKRDLSLRTGTVAYYKMIIEKYK
jgi:5-methylcytosine-specific restriction endonuclease McrA